MTEKDFTQDLRDTIKQTDPVAAAGKKILSDEWLQIQNREAGVISGKDIEDLHRMRVAARRSRVLLQAMRPVYGPSVVDSMIDDLRWVGTILGKVRDIDTFVEYFNTCNVSFPEPIRKSVQHLINTRLEERETALKTLRKEMESKRYQHWKKNFFQFAAQNSPSDSKSGSVRDEVPGLILAAFRRVIRKRKNVYSATPDELHRLRIRNKRLRYLCEFFQRCYDKRMRKLIEDFIRVQRVLGELQDKNRDLKFLNENADIINFLIKSAHSENTLNVLTDTLRVSKEATQQKFFKFWREFSLPENQERIRYIIKNAIK